MNAKTLTLALLAASTLAASGAQAAAPVTLTFQQGVNNYTGTQDTELKFASPDLATGANESFSIDGDDGPGVAPNHVLMRFDNVFGNGAGQIRAGDSILGATLRIYAFDAGSGFNLHDMLVDWNQATSTWNSLVNGVQADGTDADPTVLATFGANNGNGNVQPDYLYMDVTSSLRKVQSGQLPGYGWVFMPWPAGTNGIDVDSSESFYLTDRPLLSVEVAPVPEPETYALMLAGLGLVGYMARRRKSA